MTFLNVIQVSYLIKLRVYAKCSMTAPNTDPAHGNFTAENKRCRGVITPKCFSSSLVLLSGGFVSRSAIIASPALNMSTQRVEGQLFTFDMR